MRPTSRWRRGRRTTPAPAPFADIGNAPALRPADTDGYFVGVAISGGGSRSANFAAAVMFQLQRIGLLQRVDYLSSVSGGSLTAALYCLNDDHRWNPGEVQRRLTHSFASDMVVKLLQPWFAAALLFSDYDRSDMLAESFRDNLFTVNGREQTFADLRPDRPRLLINATDLQSGRRWIFSNRGFDEINSDLAKYPIAYAVAASASVPILLHQVTLRDFSTEYKQYRHFIDGGIADNLGVQTLIEVYEEANDDAPRKPTSRRRSPTGRSSSSSTPRRTSTRGCRTRETRASSTRCGSARA